jgi:hypothetical protein
MRWTTSIACCRAPDDVVGGDVRMHELARHVRRAVEAMTRGASGRGRVHGLSDFVPSVSGRHENPASHQQHGGCDDHLLPPCATLTLDVSTRRPE